jgi:peptide-N4-(N-acetyl-beta-glucosaminyl)asparagine amidase
MAYCIAFSNDGATDVTRRYVRNPSKALERRRCPEAVLLHILDEIRAMRRANMSKQAKFILQGEDMREAKELRDYIIQSIAHNVSKISVEDILSGRSSRPVRADPDAQKASEARANAGPEYLQARGESNAQNPREPQR